MTDNAPKPMLQPVMRQVVFVLPFLLPSLNVRDRTHWAERHRQQVTLMQEVMAALKGPAHYPRPPFANARVNVLRVAPRCLDIDNLYASAKPLLDVLKARTEGNPLGLGLIVDDAPGRCGLLVEQRQPNDGEITGTLVRIDELPYVAPEPPKKRARKPWGPRSPRAAAPSRAALAAGHRIHALQERKP